MRATENQVVMNSGMAINKIVSIRVKEMADENPDTSFLGEYTDDNDGWHICRETGEYCIQIEKRIRIIETLTDWMYDTDNPEYEKRLQARIEKIERSGLCEYPGHSREYRYFKPSAGGETPGTTEYRKYGLQDYARMEQLNRGDWCFIGIGAVAVIETANGTQQKICSGGLWGIDSDCTDYIETVKTEELSGLRNELQTLGFSNRAITYAMNETE